MKLENLFNEKSRIWLKIFKGVIIVMFFGTLLFGFIAGIGDCSAEFLDAGLGGDDDGFLDFFMWLIVGGATAFIQLFINMVFYQFLCNIQTIRESVEK